MGDHSDLDPQDWAAFRASGRRALDGMAAYIEEVRRRPVWQQAPIEIVDRFRAPLPADGRPLDDVLADFDRLVKPYANGNLHPLFMGWVHGAGTPVGMIGEMLAAGLNSNCGGRNHIAIEVERQVTRWMAELMGFPLSASGVFLTGTSMANFCAVLVARENLPNGSGIRRAGVRALDRQLVAYTSAEAHQCIRQAMEMSGIGSRYLRLVPVDGDRRMQVDALARMIAEDRENGLQPFLVVGTAGSVNTGAIDDLSAVSMVARREKIWFHVDGAFGAMARLAPRLSGMLRGIERANSIAFDFHKWLHVPYDAGFLLVRDGAAHKRAFAGEASYLTRAATGLAAGDTWPCDLGPDLSRGFRALKTWLTIEVFGADKLGAAIEQTCVRAQRLATAIGRSRQFELVAPVPLNIVCLSVKGDCDGAINRRIVTDLHERGLAVPSLTVLDGIPVIRAAIVNHRTRDSDIDEFVRHLGGALRRCRPETTAKRKSDATRRRRKQLETAKE